MALYLVTGPDVEPIDVDQVKKQAVIDADLTDQDDWIDGVVIPGCRERGELATRRQFLTATWDWKLHAFPCERFLEIPKPPLLTVVSVSYLDTSGVSQTLVANTDYKVSAPSGPRCARGRISLKYGEAWPTTYHELEAVTIRFTCGYGATADAVPAMLVQAMLLDAATLCLHRENFLAGGSSVVEFPMNTVSKGIYLSHKSVGVQAVAA